MRKFHLFAFLACAALTVASITTSCGALAGVDPQLVSDLVTAAVAPSIEKLGGIDAEQAAAITAAVGDGVAAAITAAVGDGVAAAMPKPDGSFDVNSVIPHATTAIATYLGINLRRDQKRAQRGEPTGSRPSAV